MTTTTALCAQLGQQLRAARLLAGLTQAEAGAVYGVARERWSQYERGLCADVRTLQKAAQSIGARLVCHIEVDSD